jgi:hypothetical protein
MEEKAKKPRKTKVPVDKPKVSRKKNQSNEQLCRANLARHKNTILTGRILCIDPSCGSSSSMPGYTIFNATVAEAAGTIDIPVSWCLAKRLRFLWEQLQILKEGIDLVLIERPPVKAIVIRGIRMKDKAHNSLMQSIGACKAAFTCDLIDVDASLWSRIAREQGWAATSEQHSKGDVIDAYRIGLAAIHIVGGTVSLD